MHRIRSLSRSGWMTIGLVLGVIAVPAVAFGAGAQLVTIRGNDHNASVTPAGQLRTADMDPTYDVHLSAYDGTNTAKCFSLGTPSASRAYIVKEVNMAATQWFSNSSYHYVNVLTGTDCSGSFVGTASFSGLDTVALPLGPGVAVPAGTGLSAYMSGAMEGRVDVYGYTVQDSAVPRTAAAMRRIGPTGVAVPHKAGKR